jgi:hypothetical protein
MRCRKEMQEERTLSLLDEFGYNDREVIRQLCEHAKDGSFQACHLIISIRGLKPASKVETTGAGGGPLEFAEVKNRISGLSGMLKSLKGGNG